MAVLFLSAGIFLPVQADPCPVYTPDKEARYVLEFNRGYAASHHWKVGDKLHLNRRYNLTYLFIYVILYLERGIYDNHYHYFQRANCYSLQDP